MPDAFEKSSSSIDVNDPPPSFPNHANPEWDGTGQPPIGFDIPELPPSQWGAEQRRRNDASRTQALDARAKMTEARQRVMVREIAQAVAEAVIPELLTYLSSRAPALILQHTISLVDAPNYATPMCTGIVASTGYPCSNPAAPGTDRCGKHRRPTRPQFYSPNGNMGE